jgi:ATP-dependent DNA helicase RecG
MAFPIIDISPAARDKILALPESHFCDLKAMAIQPAKLTRTISALANAEGGEVYIGVGEDKATHEATWNGFNAPEDANGHLQCFEPLFPLGEERALGNRPDRRGHEEVRLGEPQGCSTH